MIRTHVQEWDQKTALRKAGYVGVLLYTTLLYGGVVSMLYALGAALVREDVNETTFLVLWLLGWVGFAIFAAHHLARDIEESRQRLLDPNYRATLFKLGIARPINGKSPNLDA